MLCNKCHKEIESEEIKGTFGMRIGNCCSEVQVDICTLGHKVIQSVRSYDQFYNQLYLEIMKDSD
jgi:hypothetical protein